MLWRIPAHFSGLDNGEQVRNSKLETRISEHELANRKSSVGDPESKIKNPKSRSERKRMRRDMERREIERRIKEVLDSGRTTTSRNALENVQTRPLLAGEKTPCRAIAMNCRAAGRAG